MENVERSLQSIEWPDFLNYYSGLCFSPAATTLANEIHAPASQAESEQLLGLCSEAIHLLENSNFACLQSLHELDRHFDLLDKQACLSINELFEIFQLLKSSLEISIIFQNRDNLAKTPMLSNEFSKHLDCKDLHNQVNRIIDEDGGIREDASEKLFSLFKKQGRAKRKAQEAIQKELKAAQKSKHTQDSYVDIRDGKFVLPVRSEMQSEFRGIVVERSASKATVFMEPLALRNLNEEISRISLEIEEEIYRILRTISDILSMYSRDLLNWYTGLRDLDLTLARGRVAKNFSECKGSSKPIFATTFTLKEFYHPLLHLPKEEVVCNDLELDKDTRAILISGPNTGGKTVILKAIGLICQLAKCGFYVPAEEGATLPYYSQILSHVGDEQSIELSLSSFSSSALIIKEIIECADHSTLVLIDEIFASTDPREGAALSSACIAKLIELGSMTIVTTHFSELKSLAEEFKAIQNASMQFDQIKQIPEFKLILGVPGKSWALETAKRFGFSNSIIEDARARLGTTHQEVEALIDQLHKDESEAQREVQHIKALKLNIEKERNELQQAIEKLREKVRTIRHDLHEEYAAKFRASMRKLESLVDSYKEKLKNSTSFHEEMTEAKSAINELKQGFKGSFGANVDPVKTKEHTQKKYLPQKGNSVRILSSGILGSLLNEPSQAKALVQAGILKIRLDWNEIEMADTGSPRHKNRKTITASSDCPAEINLIGLSIDEALPRLQEYIDLFSRSNRPSGRIVHGHGSGKLKRFVRDFLRESAYGFPFRPGDESEGGDGCTVISEVES